MSASQLFVHEENLSRFFDRLRVERDPDRRKILRYLAIAEEDRYGQLQARLDKVDDWVRDGEARLARQRLLVDRFNAGSPHHDAAARLLNNLEELQRLLVKFRGTLRNAEQRSMR
jgi:hypothetical protein